MTVESIILSYIRSQLPGHNQGMKFHSFQFEADVFNYALKKHNVMHTPGTYSRIFRMMKQNNVFAQHSLQVMDVSNQYKGAKTKTWEITDLSKSHSASIAGTSSSQSTNSPQP